MFPKWPIFTKLKKTLPALAWFQYPLTLCEDSGECHRVRLGLRPSEAPHRVSTIGAPGGGRGAGTCSPAANTYSGGFVTRNRSSRKSSHLCSGTTFHCSPLKVTALPFGSVEHFEPISGSSSGNGGDVYEMPGLRQRLHLSPAF